MNGVTVGDKEQESLVGTYRIGIIIGIVAGLLFLVAGMVLMVLGVTGSIDISGGNTGVQGQITNASPGLVVAIVGAVLIWFFKPRLEISERGTAHTGSQQQGGGGVGVANPPGMICPNCQGRNKRVDFERLTRAHKWVDHGECVRCGQPLSPEG